MPLILSSQAQRAAGDRSVQVARTDDFRPGNTGYAGTRVPIGTLALTAGSLGTVISGNISESADKKKRPDGGAGTEALAYTALGFEAKVSVTFKVSSAAGHGPPKIGDFIQFSVPKQGATGLDATPAEGALPAAAWDLKVFSVDAIDFKFQHGEYATFDLTASHEQSLHGDTSGSLLVSARVDTDGDVLSLNSANGPVNVDAWVDGRVYKIGDKVWGTDGKVYVAGENHTALAATNKPITGSGYDDIWNLVS